MGLNVIQKMILKEHPDYDFNRYRFNEGDIVRTLDGALVVVEYSALEYVSAYPLVRSMKCRKKEFQRISYNDLPYYSKGHFKSEQYRINRSKLCWEVGDVVSSDGSIVLLYEETEWQSFYGFVLETENKYYLHTKIWLRNPMRDYV